MTFKGSLTRDFRLQVFFMDQFPTKLLGIPLRPFQILRKFPEVFATLCLLPV